MAFTHLAARDLRRSARSPWWSNRCSTSAHCGIGQPDDVGRGAEPELETRQILWREWATFLQEFIHGALQ